MASEGQNLQSLTGHGDVSIWVNNSQVERKKPPHKQPKSFKFVYMYKEYIWTNKG